MSRKIMFLTIAACVAAMGLAGELLSSPAERMRIVRDIPYAPENGKFGLGDLYLPDKVSPRTPVVLAIHGGGWGAGDRYSWSGIAEFFCRDLGCIAFNIEYRLASAKNRWPACGDDCIHAANWLFSDAFRDRAGFSPKSIYICGGSAGGHLALWTALNLPPERVAGAISISGIADSVPDRAAHPSRYRWMAGEGMPEMNPLKMIKPNGPRLLLTHAVGDKVVPVESARNFAAAYRGAGNVAEVFEYPCDVRPGLAGHCIWIPKSKPHRLIPEIEARIAEFVELEKSVSGTSLWNDFVNPPPAARPWCYWYWVNGNVDEATVTADLEAIKATGFGGVLLVDPRGYDKVVRKPPPRMPFAGDRWLEIVAFSVRECARLGLEATINLSDCGGSLKGPWLTGPDCPKRLVVGVDVDGPPPDFAHYHDIATFAVRVAPGTVVGKGWRNAGGVTSRWGKDTSVADVPALEWHRGALPATDGEWHSLRFGYCAIPKREHDVDVIDAAAVERHFKRIADPLFDRLGPLVGKTLTHVYSVSWEGAIPTWTGDFAGEFARRTGYDIIPELPALAGFSRAGIRPTLRADYCRARNDLFRERFYGTVRRLAHERGVKLYSESGGPWNRSPTVFREADQFAFLGMNDMPQGENWTVAPAHHSDLAFNRPAANAAHIYGLKRASAESFTHMDYHYSMWPEKLKRIADDAFVDGVNHIVWHTFTASPPEFGRPGIEYFAGTHLNRNVTWFGQAHAFIGYLARCQVMLQAGQPVTDIALYAGHTPYQHWGRWRTVPWEGARVSIPPGYNYDILNDETLESRKATYPVFVDASGDSVSWPALPEPDFEGDFNEVIHRCTTDGTDIYFVAPSRGRRSGQVIFRVRDKVPELWDPVAGTRRRARDCSVLPDGRIRVPLRFPRDGSVFVVFRPKAAAAADPAPESDWPSGDDVLSLTDGPWTIDIGGRRYDRLGDWTKSDDFDIRHFSGTATYRTAFRAPNAEGDMALHLGRVAGGLAEVWVNGRCCGVAWCFPYRVRIPAAFLSKAGNELEIRVVNTWRNRLIGDCLLPPDRRRTQSCLKYKAGSHNNVQGDWGWVKIAEGYSASDELESCGLFGPVELHLKRKVGCGRAKDAGSR